MIVYKGTCIINGKNYVGVTKHTLQYRVNSHKKPSCKYQSRFAFTGDY